MQIKIKKRANSQQFIISNL